MLKKIKDRKKEKEIKKAKDDYDKMFHNDIYKREKELEQLNKLEKACDVLDKVNDTNLWFGTGSTAIPAMGKVAINKLKKDIKEEKKNVINR